MLGAGSENIPRIRPPDAAAAAEVSLLPTGRQAMSTNFRRSSVAACVMVAAAFALSQPAAHAAKTTECAKVGVCYCVNDELKSTIAGRIERFRQLIADHRKAGKAVGYLSVPLTSAGGGNFKILPQVLTPKGVIEAL